MLMYTTLLARGGGYSPIKYTLLLMNIGCVESIAAGLVVGGWNSSKLVLTDLIQGNYLFSLKVGNILIFSARLCMD